MNIKRIIINNKTKDLNNKDLFMCSFNSMFNKKGFMEYAELDDIKIMVTTINDKYAILFRKNKGSYSLTFFNI